MAQVHYTDSGLMVDQGETLAEYEALYDSDPAFAITESLQAFPDDWKDHVWFWVPTLSEYFTREGNLHPLLCAAKTLFTAERWEEISDALDEFGPIARYLDQMDIQKVKRKALRAKDIGLITQAELTTLSGLLN